MRVLIFIVCITMGLHTMAQTTTERNWVDTEVTYTNAQGNTVRVTNSLPKGGGTYTDTNGTTYSYVLFWYKITNESESPLEIALAFPPESYKIFPSPNSHVKILLPTETMTPKKITEFDYGLSNLKEFWDGALNEPSNLKKTILPKEEYYVYVSVLIHEAQGSARTALIIKDQELFYHISIHPNAALLPCGQITFTH